MSDDRHFGQPAEMIKIWPHRARSTGTGGYGGGAGVAA